MIMKKSNIIIIVLIFSTLSVLIFAFAKSKYDDKNKPYDYNSTKYNFDNITTIILDNQINCYIQSGDSNVVDFRYWGKNEDLPAKLDVKNDTLILKHKFNKTSSSIHIKCKEIKKIIVSNKSALTISSFESELLNVEALSRSHITLSHIGKDNDSVKKSLNINIDINDNSVLSINNSIVEQLNINASKAYANISNSEVGDFSIDLKNGSRFWDRKTEYLNRFKLKSDNKSKYYIQDNKNEKK